MKKILTLLLLVFVGASVAAILFKGLKPQAAKETPAVAAENPARGHKVLVTYFTTNVRCKSCLRIEALTREALTGAFAEQLERGEVEFRVINTDAPGNGHFVDDYKLVSKTVIVSDTLDGKERSWANLDQVWDLLNEPEKFHQYVAEAVRKHLGS